METEYDVWNDQKKKIAQLVPDIVFKEGDVWWCSLGKNIGEEVYGKGQNFMRPVIVFRKLTSTACVILPLSTVIKEGSWYFTLAFNHGLSSVLMHQIRMVSSKRFESRMGTLSEIEFRALKNAVAKFYDIL